MARIISTSPEQSFRCLEDNSTLDESYSSLSEFSVVIKMDRRIGSIRTMLCTEPSQLF